MLWNIEEEVVEEKMEKVEGVVDVGVVAAVELAVGRGLPRDH